MVTIWTVGHSTRPIQDFLDVLGTYKIELVADVRRFPGSRRLPQYQQPALESALAAAGSSYAWIPGLGGRRRPVSHSRITAWRHPAFQGYADYAMGEEFATALGELITLAQGLRTAVMCAEILWWRCHRRIIADVLVSLGATVIHILDARTASTHQLTTPAKLVDGILSYSLPSPARSATTRRT